MASYLTNEQARELALLWARSEPTIRICIIASLGNCDQVDDVLQDVATAVTAQFVEYDRERPFGAWVQGITHKRIAMFCRTRSRDRHVFSDAALENVAAAASQVNRDDYESQLSAMQACIKKLVGRGRQIIEMRYQRGWQVQKIAGELGMSRVAVSGVLYRARAALKQCIENRLKAEQ